MALILVAFLNFDFSPTAVLLLSGAMSLSLFSLVVCFHSMWFGWKWGIATL